MKKSLRPIDLARAVGLSVQTVHNYEQLGFIPAAARSEKGYRLYAPRHLRALRVARVVIQGHGWERAWHIMRFVHEGRLAPALAIIDAHHAQISQERQEVEKTLDILRATSTSLTVPSQGSSRHRKGLRVGEVAQAAGVRVSAVRFWEDQGLLHPVRDHESNYRLYDDEQVRRLQIIVLLRKAGYDFEAIRTVLAQLATGTSEQVLAAAENRLKELTEVSHRAFEANATLWSYVEEIELGGTIEN